MKGGAVVKTVITGERKREKRKWANITSVKVILSQETNLDNK